MQHHDAFTFPEPVTIVPPIEPGLIVVDIMIYADNLPDPVSSSLRIEVS